MYEVVVSGWLTLEIAENVANVYRRGLPEGVTVAVREVPPDNHHFEKWGSIK